MGILSALDARSKRIEMGKILALPPILFLHSSTEYGACASVIVFRLRRAATTHTLVLRSSVGKQ